MALPLALIALALGTGANVLESGKERRGIQTATSKREHEAGLMEAAAEGGDLGELFASESENVLDFAQKEAERRAEARRTQPTRDIDFRIREGDERAQALTAKLQNLELQQQQGIGLNPDDLRSTSFALADDRRAELQPFKDQLSSFDQLMSVIDVESGPASMAVLFKFIKSMDDSVVRESEGRLLTSASGPVRQMVNLFNQIQGGGLFDQQTRDEIKQAASLLAEGSFNVAKQVSADHDKRAAQFAETFQAPAIEALSRGTGFDPTRTFDPVTIRPRDPTNVIPDDEIPEGFSTP